MDYAMFKELKEQHNQMIIGMNLMIAKLKAIEKNLGIEDETNKT